MTLNKKKSRKERNTGRGEYGKRNIRQGAERWFGHWLDESTPDDVKLESLRIKSLSALRP